MLKYTFEICKRFWKPERYERFMHSELVHLVLFNWIWIKLVLSGITMNYYLMFCPIIRSTLWIIRHYFFLKPVLYIHFTKLWKYHYVYIIKNKFSWNVSRLNSAQAKVASQYLFNLLLWIIKAFFDLRYYSEIFTKTSTLFLNYST